MTAGAVAPLTGLGDLAGANGVAVLGGSSYTADGNRVVEINNSTGVVSPSPVAGQVGSTTSCLSGTGISFNTSTATPLRVVGADGRFVYVTDLCGIRRIDPSTKAVTMLWSAGTYSYRTASVAIAGQWMYVVDNYYGRLYKINLNSGVATPLYPSGQQPTQYGAVAADDQNVWMVNTTTLFQINRDTGAIIGSWPVNVNGNAPTALLSVGNYLYASIYTSGGAYPTIIRITKTVGTSTLITGTGLTDITGIVTDGASLYVADRGGVKSVA